MKICFSTLGCHDLPLNEILALAKDFSVNAIEVRGIAGELDNLKITDFFLEHVEKTKDLMKQANVLPLILGTSCKFHDFQKRASMVEKACQEVLIAQRMGFQAIRVFGNLIVGNEHQCILSVAQAIDEVCAFAHQHQVKVYLEVHGDFNTVERLTLLIEQIHHKEDFGLIWDIYHTHSVYKEKWMDFYQAMKPYIHHVHLKDCAHHDLVLPGYGELQIVPIVQTLLKDGYNGYFSLEWERKWHPELPELKEALKALQQLFYK